MPTHKSFAPVAAKPDFVALEHDVLTRWREGRTFERLRAQNAGGPRWSFLDGPLTANNPLGGHHAWGRTYKDAYNRYFALAGRELRYQQGFDCQGLWDEVEFEKELKLQPQRVTEERVPGEPGLSGAAFVPAG